MSWAGILGEYLVLQFHCVQNSVQLDLKLIKNCEVKLKKVQRGILDF